MVRAANACCGSVRGSARYCSASGAGEFVAGGLKANGLSLSCVGRPLSS